MLKLTGGILLAIVIDTSAGASELLIMGRLDTSDGSGTTDNTGSDTGVEPRLTGDRVRAATSDFMLSIELDAGRESGPSLKLTGVWVALAELPKSAGGGVVTVVVVEAVGTSEMLISIGLSNTSG